MMQKVSPTTTKGNDMYPDIKNMVFKLLIENSDESDEEKKAKKARFRVIDGGGTKPNPSTPNTTPNSKLADFFTNVNAELESLRQQSAHNYSGHQKDPIVDSDIDDTHKKIKSLISFTTKHLNKIYGKDSPVTNQVSNYIKQHYKNNTTNTGVVEHDLFNLAKTHAHILGYASRFVSALGDSNHDYNHINLKYKVSGDRSPSLTDTVFSKNPSENFLKPKGVMIDREYDDAYQIGRDHAKKLNLFENQTIQQNISVRESILQILTEGEVVPFVKKGSLFDELMTHAKQYVNANYNGVGRDNIHEVLNSIDNRDKSTLRYSVLRPNVYNRLKIHILHGFMQSFVKHEHEYGINHPLHDRVDSFVHNDRVNSEPYMAQYMTNAINLGHDKGLSAYVQNHTFRNNA